MADQDQAQVQLQAPPAPATLPEAAPPAALAPAPAPVSTTPAPGPPPAAAQAAAVASPPPGVFVPVPTFFRPAPPASTALQAPVDVDAQVQHSLFLAHAGIAGLVLLGSTGEAVHLTRTERCALVSGVRAGLDAGGFPGYPLMAGVLANGLDEALEALDDYAAAGAQWGLVLAPGYFGAAATQDNLKEWYRLVADRSPVPVLVYNYPGVTNNVMVAPETYTELAQHPNIVGCKMSHGNVSHHVQVSLDPAIDHAKFRVYSGFGQQLGPIVFFGAAGVIDGMAAFYPKTVVRLMSLITSRLAGGEAVVDADALAEMHRLQYAVSRGEEFIVRFGIVGIKEATYRLTGLGTLEGGRLPLKGRLAEGDWEKWHALLLSDIEKIEATLP